MKNKKKYATVEDLLIPRMVTEDLLVMVNGSGERYLASVGENYICTWNNWKTGGEQGFNVDYACSWEKSEISIIEPKKQYTVELTDEQLTGVKALGVVVNEDQDDE